MLRANLVVQENGTQMESVTTAEGAAAEMFKLFMTKVEGK